MFSFHENSLAGGCPPDPHPTVARRDHGARSAGQDTGWRTRATRPPPTVQPSRVRLHPVSVARSSAARMSSSPVGKPEIGGTPTPHRVEFVRYRRSHGLGFRRIAPQTPRMAVSAVFRASGGTGLGCLPPVGQRPIHGRNPLTRAGQGQAPGGPSRITSAGSSGQDGATLGPSPPRRVSRGGAPPRPPLPWRAGNAGVRGGRAPRQPPQGTHGVWPHGVRWLNDETGVRQHPRAAPTNAPIRPTAPAPFDGSHAWRTPLTIPPFRSRTSALNVNDADQRLS